MKIKRVLTSLLAISSALAMVVAVAAPRPAMAAQLTSRKLVVSTSAPSATGVSYTFSFTAPSATTVKSVAIDICTTASGTCTLPGATPISTTSATVGSVTNLGTGGSWTGTFTTNGHPTLANASNTGSPSGTSTIVLNNITNGSTTNQSMYARITTYSDTLTTVIDSGTTASSTANQISVSGSVDESLTFCTGTSGITSSSCAGATGTTVSLGSLTPSSTGSGTSQIGVATNASGGYSITVNGSTLTSGANTITALAAQTASTQGSSQFGMNLLANTTPAVGSNPAGAGTTNPTANYNTTNQYRFVTADQIVNAAAADNFRLFTVSYIANVSNLTPAGTYSTTLTYIATATF